MFDRSYLPALLCASLVLPLTGFLAGCTSSSLTVIQVSPGTATAAAGTQVQFSATGVYTGTKGSQNDKNVTSSVTWTSSSQAVATIDASGMATAVAAGTATITATANGFPGLVSGSATITVTGSSTGGGGGSAQGDIVSITVTPGAQTVASPGQTSQFIAIGTTASKATVSLTNQVVWSTSSPQIATVGASSGLAKAVGQGADTITALYTNSDATVVTGTATFTVTGGTTEQFTAVTITPTSEALSATGQTGQFIALATSGSTGLLEDVTNSVQLEWSSSIPSVATVSTSGLATGASPGTSTISALLTNPDGSKVSGTATVVVSAETAVEPLLSLTIIPSSITVGNLQDTGQFLAIGTFSTIPYVRDLTNSVTWISSSPSVFPVNTNTAGSAGNTAGIVSAFGTGGATIIAEATSSDQTIQTATATFNCPLVLPNPPTVAGSCYPGSQAAALLATLTVYNEGSNTTDWLVTAPSATGTPSVIHCGPGSTSGGSVCVATYPVGSTVTLTAPANGAAFGGWSYNCVSSAPITAAGPNSCSVQLTTNETVGAIFN
jgi:hypothetical protein